MARRADLRRPDEIDAYIKTYDSRMSSDYFRSFQTDTGGYDLVSIRYSAPYRIKFRVKELDTAIKLAMEKIETAHAARSRPE